MNTDAVRRRALRDAQWWPERKLDPASHAEEFGDEVRLPCLDSACEGFMVHIEAETISRACGAFIHECDKCGDLRMIRAGPYPYLISETEPEG